MKYETMKSRILPAPVLINNFIQGIEPYTYEAYLVEVVNATSYFLEKSNHELYTHPTKEDHGEWDCVSVGYAMDFKLIASESRLRALNLFSPQIVVEKGFVCYCAPKMGPGNKRYRLISAVRIFAALRFLNLDDLKEIRGEQTFREKAHKDIRFLLEVLETDKNLFLFFPYNMSFNDEGSFEEGLDIALTGIGRDFHNSLLYRSEVCPNRDTYFCFVYAKHFIISVWVDEALRFLDAIPMQKSPLFMKLIDYVDAMY